MARPKKAENQNEESDVQSSQLPLEETLFTLRLGSVQVPYIEDGKGGWKTVNQRDWNLKDQSALFDYWRNLLFDGLDDDKKQKAIEAKKAKLFMPESEDE